ncbi:MAG: Cohesin subunit SA-3 [Paramarteilia canceri]
MLVIGTLFDGTTTPELVKDLSIQNAIQSIDLAILEYLQAKVFNTPTINSKEDNLKQEVLMAYCSLLMKQIFSLNHFKYILVHFSGHSIFNEIIKHVLGELKKYSPSLTCKIIHECFLDRFEECLNDLEVNNEFNRLSSGFIKLNELVKKILMNFGVNISKFKNILLLIQKMAIDYLVKNSDFDTSNQSVYAFFLELHAPLFKKMSNDDQKLLAMYFDQETKGKFENVSKTWPSVGKYFGIKQTEQQNALYQDEDSILEE